jgi:adenylate cyclase
VRSLGSDDKATITIGRIAANDVVIPGTQVSRWHARIERRGGKWVLCDRSTNGTLLEPDEGQRVLVHREELLLPRSGRLGVGAAELAEGDLLPVRFEWIDEAPESGPA